MRVRLSTERWIQRPSREFQNPPSEPEPGIVRPIGFVEIVRSVSRS
jgi:hypothetical protein